MRAVWGCRAAMCATWGCRAAAWGCNACRVGDGSSPPFCPPQTLSQQRLRRLEELQAFVAAAAQELRWLSAREEEEVAFDWSDRNPAMAAKKDAYSVRSAAGPCCGMLRGAEGCCGAVWGDGG